MANTKFITKTIIGEDLYYLKDKQVRDSIGQANGIATLDSTGKVTSTQLPSGTSLPSQTGNNGKFLTTDGTDASWASIPSDNTKADKVSGATNGNFAGLDANGNVKDSGKKPSDFQSALTFDSTPTANSNNPVTSGGIKNYVDDAIIDLPIPFENEGIKQYIVEKFGGVMGGQSHDIPGIRGEITYRQALAVTNMDSLFYHAPTVFTNATFNEFKFFKNVTGTSLMFQEGSFTSVYFPEGIVSIQGQSMTNVVGYIDIPSSVTSIGIYNFWYSEKEVVRLWATTPPSIDYSTNYSVKKILVPQSALSAYQAHAQWSQYGSKLEGF